MSNAFDLSFANDLTDESLLRAFQTACRMGYVVAEGRRVKFLAHEGKPGQLDVTKVVESKWERNPDEDWSDLWLRYWDGECRLEGTRRWFSPQPAFELKAWHSIRFRPNSKSLDLLRASAPLRQAGAKGTLRQEAADFIARQYLGVIPRHVKIDAICQEFKEQTGHPVSNRTMRRALGRK